MSHHLRGVVYNLYPHRALVKKKKEFTSVLMMLLIKPRLETRESEEGGRMRKGIENKWIERM